MPYVRQVKGRNDSVEWTKFIDSLLVHDWCVFIEPPPTNESTPEHVLKYLARYMTGGPISDGRLVSCTDTMVTFMALSKDKLAKGHVPVKLPGVELTRCWSLHILLKGFTKSRCFGGYSSRIRKNFIALCQRLISPPAEANTEQGKIDQADQNGAIIPSNADTEDHTPCCPQCKQRMQLISETYRPLSSDLFYGPDHHAWLES